jgi:hypothetical protein
LSGKDIGTGKAWCADAKIRPILAVRFRLPMSLYARSATSRAAMPSSASCST